MAVGFPIDSYWPFLTSMFLHGGFMHVIGNMWSLWIFGDNVEERMGRSRYLIYYLLTGLFPHAGRESQGAGGAALDGHVDARLSDHGGGSAAARPQCQVRHRRRRPAADVALPAAH